MFGYYFQLAIRSLRRNVVLTALMIAAVGVGIGAAMTMLTTLRAMSGDPIPDKSSQLFVPQIDVWGPDSRRGASGTSNDRLPDQMTYRDAMELMRAHKALHQTAMYSVGMDVDPGTGRPFQASGRAAYADFFTLFEVPFREGAPWSAADDAGHTDVVVLSARLADRLFPSATAVGRTVSMDGHEYRVVGVLQPWSPVPRFYDTNTGGGGFANTEDFFLPFTTAIDRQLDTQGNLNCTALPPAGWDGLLASECIWLQFWVELPTAAAVRDYRAFLHNYAAEQRQQGRFHWPPRVELHDVNDWMVQEGVVPEQVRVNTLIGLGFLVVCLINAIGLMLAKFGSRAAELGVRRALGGSRRDIFLQCLVETAVVGLVGGLLGLALTATGLAVDRALLAPGAKNVTLDALTHIDGGMLAIILVVAVAATVCAGLYPTWRASRVQPAWQLKAQ
ncbi:MAG TPA: ABC transporter permease [Steroidobacteraceae bacterium]|nr:ABC transporter permease [Steroidobacteraceae bacterium]